LLLHRHVEADSAYYFTEDAPEAMAKREGPSRGSGTSGCRTRALTCAVSGVVGLARLLGRQGGAVNVDESKRPSPPSM